MIISFYLFYASSFLNSWKRTWISINQKIIEWVKKSLNQNKLVYTHFYTHLSFYHYNPSWRLRHWFQIRSAPKEIHPQIWRHFSSRNTWKDKRWQILSIWRGLLRRALCRHGSVWWSLSNNRHASCDNSLQDISKTDQATRVHEEPRQRHRKHAHKYLQRSTLWDMEGMCCGEVWKGIRRSFNIFRMSTALLAWRREKTTKKECSWSRKSQKRLLGNA